MICMREGRRQGAKRGVWRWMRRYIAGAYGHGYKRVRLLRSALRTPCQRRRRFMMQLRLEPEITEDIANTTCEVLQSICKV